MKSFLFIILFFVVGRATVHAQDSSRKDRVVTRDDKDIVFVKVEIEPEYIGGRVAWKRYLKNTLKYPPEAREQGIQGEVVIKFIVDKEGEISDVAPVRGQPLLMEEAIRLIKNSGKWKPAIQNGHKVRAYKQQTIKFALD